MADTMLQSRPVSNGYADPRVSTLFPRFSKMGKRTLPIVNRAKNPCLHRDIRQTTPARKLRGHQETNA